MMRKTSAIVKVPPRNSAKTRSLSSSSLALADIMLDPMSVLVKLARFRLCKRDSLFCARAGGFWIMAPSLARNATWPRGTKSEFQNSLSNINLVIYFWTHIRAKPVSRDTPGLDRRKAVVLVRTSG